MQESGHVSSSGSGIIYEPAEKSKSEIYGDLLPLINSGAVDLLEHERLMFS